MFSLIITVIAIALVAALAVATLYYGGEVFVSQHAKTAAATLDAQAQQVFAASQAYYQDHQAWPANVAVLAAGGRYLSAAPTPPASAYLVAFADGLIAPAYADGGNGVGLPALSRPVGEYLADAATLVTDYTLTSADATVLQTQLRALQAKTDATGTDLATRALQLMQRESAARSNNVPSALDYTWPAAATQVPKSRFLWVPSKISQEVCQAANQQWRHTTNIPAAYSALNGTVQCFGDAKVGSSSRVHL